MPETVVVECPLGPIGAVRDRGHGRALELLRLPVDLLPRCDVGLVAAEQLVAALPGEHDLDVLRGELGDQVGGQRARVRERLVEGVREDRQQRGGIRLDGVKVVDEGLFGTAAARIAGTNDLVSYQVGGVWQPSDRISLYAGYAKGKYIAINTEAGNLSSNFAKRAAPVPESSNQVEVGFKAEPIPGVLSVNGALFETKRRDFFVTLVTGADPVQQGRQRSRGAEMDFVFTPITGLSLTGNAAYVDAKNLSTALVTVTGIAANQSSYGKRLAATPRWSGNLWANYVVQSGALEGLTLGAGATFKSATYVDALELLKVPGYTVLRAAIGYDFGPIEAQLTVANLTDRTYYTVPTFSGALPGESRSVHLTLRTKI